MKITVSVQLGQIQTKRCIETKPNYHFWRDLSRKLGTVHAPAPNTTKGAGKLPKPLLQPHLDALSTPHPMERTSLLPSHLREHQQGNLFVLTTPCCSRAQIKPCLNFLSGIWSISVDWEGHSMRPGQEPRPSDLQSEQELVWSRVGSAWWQMGERDRRLGSQRAESSWF